MKHIFYFFAFFAILWEGINIIYTKEIYKKVIRIISLKKENFKELADGQKYFLFFMFGYFLWIFTGLFTFQWPIFLLLFLMSLIPKKWIVIRWIDAFISLVILIFILINAYHLHIDIFPILKSLF